MWPKRVGRHRTNRGGPCRRLGIERLESRRLLVGEGDVYSLSRNMDIEGLVGTVQASVSWGDGTTSAATIQGGQTANKIKTRIDYSLDTSGFFTAARRQLLQSALDSVAGRFSDTLTAIAPSGSNTWSASFLHPSTGQTIQRSNLSIAQNELLIFAGARAMPGPQLGIGGPGGFSAVGTSTFLSTVQSRGQAAVTGANATDFGPWGGSLAFDTSANWHFGQQTDGLVTGEFDFVTTAIHEFMHILGVGTSASWQRLVAGETFRGPKSVAAYDGPGDVPLASDRVHWIKDLQDGGREVVMDPDQSSGVRKLNTALDFAALDDLGWEIPAAIARVTASHVFPDNGSYPIAVTLTGSRLGARTESLSVNITNVVPTLVVATDRTVPAGQAVSISDIGSISDPGFRNTAADPDTLETFTYSIEWGDGTSAQTGSATIDQTGNATRPTLASFNGSHTYVAAGIYTVRVSVSDDDGGTATQTMTVTVMAPPVLSLALNRNRIVEDGSLEATLTVRRSGGDITTPLVVTLRSSDASEATVPTSVTIPASTTSVVVPVNAVDDALLDGDQSVRLTAEAAASVSAAIDLVVADAEKLSAVFVENVVSEGLIGVARLRITRGNTNIALPLVVAITGGDPTELQPVSAAVIPAGQSSVVVPLTVINDDDHDRTQAVTLNVSAGGYLGSSATVQILDDEPPLFQNPADPLDVNNDGVVRPIDALRIINFLNRQGGPRDLEPDSDPPFPYYDVDGDYRVTPLDALRIINAINRGETQ